MHIWLWILSLFFAACGGFWLYEREIRRIERQLLNARRLEDVCKVNHPKVEEAA